MPVTGYRPTAVKKGTTSPIYTGTMSGSTGATFTALEAGTPHVVSVVAIGDGTVHSDSPAATLEISTAPGVLTCTTGCRAVTGAIQGPGYTTHRVVAGGLDWGQLKADVWPIGSDGVGNSAAQGVVLATSGWRDDLEKIEVYRKPATGTAADTLLGTWTSAPPVARSVASGGSGGSARAPSTGTASVKGGIVTIPSTWSETGHGADQGLDAYLGKDLVYRLVIHVKETGVKHECLITLPCGLPKAEVQLVAGKPIITVEGIHLWDVAHVHRTTDDGVTWTAVGFSPVSGPTSKAVITDNDPFIGQTRYQVGLGLTSLGGNVSAWWKTITVTLAMR